MLTKKIVTAVATSSMLLFSFGSAFADTTVGVVGNGTGSQNTAVVSSSNTTSVSQNNTTNVTNDSDTHQNSGGNQAGYNTGGSVMVQTGNNTSTNTISNSGGLNTANVQDCGCNNGITALVEGNGASSTDPKKTTNSSLTVGSTNTTSLNQNNNTTFNNYVDTTQNSGKNNTGYNTGAVGGGSTVSVMTGDNKSVDTISNLAGANSATIGGGSSASAGGPTAAIVGNGSGAQDSITLALTDSTSLNQGNTTNVTNDVDTHQNSGKNDAGFNTGANVMLQTGDNTSINTISNAAGFNSADVADCGCVLGNGLFKILGNGDGSASQLVAAFSNGLNVGQGNNNTFRNPLDTDQYSGSNNAGYNTGAVIGVDPVTVQTGNESSTNTVSTNGGVNAYGPGASLTLPGNLGNLQVSMDFAQFWAQAMAAWTAFAAH